MIHDPSDRISLQPHSGTVRIYLGDTMVADADHAVALHEKGYPDRQYLPREALVAGSLQPSETQTYCPFKGSATYFDYALEDRVIRDAVWCYQAP